MLNIVSPGGLPNSLTQADLQQGRSEIRNRVLARVFKELGYIEQWGRGIGRIKAMCREAGNAEPKIQERGDFVDWEFYRLKHFGNVISETDLNQNEGGSIPDEADLTERQQQVLALIKADSQMPYRKMAECMGINESALKKHLNKLKEAGYIRRIGGTRGYWEVKQ